MLQEQRRINEELMGQMRQMQMSMTDMRSHMAGGSGGSGGSGGGGGGGGGGGPVHHQPEIGGFGSGYGGGYGGGKMPMSMYGGRSLPYNMRVPKHPGEYHGLTEELYIKILTLHPAR